MKTVSVTIRFPEEILDDIDARVKKERKTRIKANRTEVVLTLLQAAMANEQQLEREEAESFGKLLEKSITQLREELREEFGREVEELRRQMEASAKEQSHAVLTLQDSETECITEESGAIIYKPSEETSSKSQDIESERITETPNPPEDSFPKNMELQINTTQDSVKQRGIEVQIISNRELLKILKKIDPDAGWTGRETIKHRNGKKKKEWHKVGSLNFKYYGVDEDAPPKSKHTWEMYYS